VGAVVEGIRREIKKSKISIKLMYSSNKFRSNLVFSQQPGPMLMKRCNEEAKRQYKELINGNQCYNITQVGIAAPIIKNKIIDKNINILVREFDAKLNELEAIKEKVSDKYK